MSEIKVVNTPYNQTSEQAVNAFAGNLSAEQYTKLLHEVIIRFNTSPKTYEKEDFKKLIQSIIGARKISDYNIQLLQEDLQSLLNTKVDKESGKSLMTDVEHQKLANIAEGAEVNVQSDWNAVSGDSFIKNKPTKLSRFIDDLGLNPEHTHSLYLTEHQSLTDCVKFTDEASSLKAGIVKLGDDSILEDSVSGYINCLVQRNSSGALAVKVPDCDYASLTYDLAMSILNSTSN